MIDVAALARKPVLVSLVAALGLSGCAYGKFEAQVIPDGVRYSGELETCFKGCGWRVFRSDGSECTGFSGRSRPREASKFTLHIGCPDEDLSRLLISPSESKLLYRGDLDGEPVLIAFD